jgi:hypothetical protein
VASALTRAKGAYRRSLLARHYETRKKVRRLQRELAEERSRVQRVRNVLNPPIT